VSILDLISKIGAEEKALIDLEFVSPVFNNTQVATRVSGIVYTFIIPKVKPGWYKIKPTDTKFAKVVGEAGLSEIEKYQKYLRDVRVTVAQKKDGIYMGIIGTGTMDVFGQTAYVLLADDTISDFDRVICKYDGCNFWYSSLDSLNDPSKADYLRESMAKLVPPEKIKYKGLVFDEKAAYGFRVGLDLKYAEEMKRIAEEARKTTLQKDVEYAGGQFVNSEEKSDHYSVTYIVDGHQYTSYISKDPSHRVITAGICLAGTDHRFDLKSLITVMREGQRRHLIHRTMHDEDDDDGDWED
jgi:hypothetical protein